MSRDTHCWRPPPSLACAAIADGPGRRISARRSPLGDGVTLDPIIAARLRYETVDQANFPTDADALTLRGRLGAELKADGFSFLAEGEGTLALADDYNDTLPGNGVEPFPTVADPENLELNRLQVSYMKNGTGVTLGRQRIKLDNQRFVGNGRLAPERADFRRGARAGQVRPGRARRELMRSRSARCSASTARTSISTATSCCSTAGSTCRWSMPRPSPTCSTTTRGSPSRARLTACW